MGDLTKFTDKSTVLSINQARGGDAMTKPHNKLRGSWRNIVNLPISTANIQAGQVWYVDANKIARTVGRLAGFIDTKATSVGAGVISALSPRREWDLNISQAILLVAEGTKKHFTVQHDKAVAILHGKDPVIALGVDARKTQAFYQAIVYPNNEWSMPVIDRHPVAVYMGRSVSEKELKLLESPRVYNRIQNAYIKASNHVGMNRHILQAMTWTQWREDKGITQPTSRQVAEV